MISPPAASARALCLGKAHRVVALDRCLAAHHRDLGFERPVWHAAPVIGKFVQHLQEQVLLVEAEKIVGNAADRDLASAERFDLKTQFCKAFCEL